MNQYLSMFIDESRDHLQAMNDNMLKLEASPEDIAIVHEIFRSAHTLKGMSATMGFEDLASLTHEMENVLDLVRNHKLAMSQGIFDVLFRSFDALESMVDDIIGGGTGKADVTDIVAQLGRIVSGDVPAASGKTNSGAAAPASGFLDEFQLSVVRQSVEAGYRALLIDVTIRKDCLLKAARAYMVFDALEDHGEVLQSNPSVEDIEQDRFDQSFSICYVTQQEQDYIRKLAENVSEVERVEIRTLDADTLQAKPMQPSSPAPASAALAEPASASAKPAAQPAGEQARQGAAANRTIRVDIERLDMLMNLFSELLIDRVRLEQLASEIRRSELTETVEHMARVSSDLQNIVLKLRMVPVESVFNRFPRMIRDLARSLDKKVDLRIIGAETELDRTVIDEIGDPLVHLLRNAVDHGIEPVNDRIAAGKPETGTIHLRAFHSGNHVFIEIQEDGRGINRDKVLNTALKKGLVAPEAAHAMKDEEVYQLLFASGFSTADKISDISGRGVGLDVVKTKIQSLGGHVHVESNPGAGTKFVVQLPLTLSIISAMLVKLGVEKYAIPLASIVETVNLQKTKIRRVHGVPMIDYRDSVVPVVSLKKLLETPGWGDPEPEEINLLVVRKGERLAALMVDEFIAQQEIVLKSLGPYLKSTFAVSGATILGDGQVALILDPNAVVK